MSEQTSLLNSTSHTLERIRSIKVPLLYQRWTALLFSLFIFFICAGDTALSQQAKKASGKPNILVIWGDDIGYWNVSTNNQGMMGYKTPNIDRIAKEGANFTDWYGQQSCTGGRACP